MRQELVDTVGTISVLAFVFGAKVDGDDSWRKLLRILSLHGPRLDLAGRHSGRWGQGLRSRFWAKRRGLMPWHHKKATADDLPSWKMLATTCASGSDKVHDACNTNNPRQDHSLADRMSLERSEIRQAVWAIKSAAFDDK